MLRGWLVLRLAVPQFQLPPAISAEPATTPAPIISHIPRQHVDSTSHRRCWLQQTPAHSRNRIRERRYLSVFRRATCGVSRADVVGVKNAVLQFQHQATLSVDPDPIAAKRTSADEITRLRTRPRRVRARIEAKFSTHSWSNRTGVSSSLK